MISLPSCISGTESSPELVDKLGEVEYAKEQLEDDLRNVRDQLAQEKDEKDKEANRYVFLNGLYIIYENSYIYLLKWMACSSLYKIYIFLQLY